jgi:surface protein
MLADRVRMSYIKGGIPDYYVLATDDDFYDLGDGQFMYSGYDSHIIIPHVIQGVPITSYTNMFTFTIVEGVASYNKNVTDMSHMFENSRATTLDLRYLDTSNVTDMSSMFQESRATTLDLRYFDTSNVIDMSSMFQESRATTLDLGSFDTSNVTDMSGMFINSRATTLDLSSFDTSNVIYMYSMFEGSAATTGYARTQADANRFNASSNKPSGLVFVVK